MPHLLLPDACGECVTLAWVGHILVEPHEESVRFIEEDNLLGQMPRKAVLDLAATLFALRQAKAEQQRKNGEKSS